MKFTTTLAGLVALFASAAPASAQHATSATVTGFSATRNATHIKYVSPPPFPFHFLPSLLPPHAITPSLTSLQLPRNNQRPPRKRPRDIHPLHPGNLIADQQRRLDLDRPKTHPAFQCRQRRQPGPRLAERYSCCGVHGESGLL